MGDTRPVLLVEDDVIDAATVKRAFRDLGLPRSLVHATDGEDALAYLRGATNPKPFIILLDLNMPRMNGLEFLKAMKGKPAWRAIPVVVLTTSGETRDLVDSYRLGAGGYVIKPVDYRAFVQAIQVVHRYWSLCESPAVSEGSNDAPPQTDTDR
jgi:CheY-like chemotaxis protein